MEYVNFFSTHRDKEVRTHEHDKLLFNIARLQQAKMSFGNGSISGSANWSPALQLLTVSCIRIVADLQLASPFFGLFQGPLDRPRQLRQMVLADVVIRAGQNSFSDGILADYAGNDDKCNFRILLPDNLQGMGPAEIWHAAVSNHNIPAFPVERMLHRLRCFHHSDVVQEVSGLLQLTHDQQGIIGIVLDD